MKASQLILGTQRENPADAEIISHQLMIRAGLVRQVSSGIYNWLPLGKKILQKVENIIRKEMDVAGGQEILMPMVQPASLWEDSGRIDQYGQELLVFLDRHQNKFCLGPTHEEIITDLCKNLLTSYKQLPVTLFQIQTKFRDEIRPRFGVMRSREFVMKDGYSFHIDQTSQEETYWRMHQAYTCIFTRLGLDFRAVEADSGAIGGSLSHEFHVLAASGEDAIAFSDSSSYAANVEMAEAVSPAGERPAPGAAMSEVATPGQHTIEEVCAFLKLEPAQTVKTLLVEGDTEEAPIVALVLRGDHQLNTIKAEKL